MIPAMLLLSSDAMLLGANNQPSVLRRPAAAARAVAPRADLSAFEKSFMDDLYIEDYLDKNAALCELRNAMPSLLKPADTAALRRGIDEAREAKASVGELKPFILALQKADPSMVTAVDDAILAGADQAAEAAAPQPAKQPLDSFLLPEQWEALLAASKSVELCWDDKSQGPIPDELATIWGRPSSFFSLLRHPRIDPSPVVWKAVRQRWAAIIQHSQHAPAPRIRPGNGRGTGGHVHAGMGRLVRG